MSATFSICSRCAAVNPTCCATSPEHADACFPLSIAERDRLRPHADALGVPAAEEEVNSQSFLELMSALFPDRLRELRDAYPLNGVHLRLPLDKQGKCMFLQDTGCALPRPARPWYCQLFPIWIREGYFVRFESQACLLSHEVRRLRDVFSAIGLTREKAKEMYCALCRDWGIEKNDK